MKSFYGGKRDFRSVEYESQWRHRNILFTPVPDIDLAGQPVSAWTFNLDMPINGKTQREHDDNSKNFILYNNLYDEGLVNSLDYTYRKDHVSEIYLDIIKRTARWHKLINNNDRSQLGNLSIPRFPANINSNRVFLQNLIKAIPKMSDSDNKFFKTFVEVTNAPTGSLIELEDLKEDDISNYTARINQNNFYNALPQLPLETKVSPGIDHIKIVYINEYNSPTDVYKLPPPGREFLTMFNYVGFMEKIMDSGLPPKIPDDRVIKLFSEDDLTKIITEIGVIKEIWFRDAAGDLAYKDNRGDTIKLNDKDKKRVINKFFNVSRDTCMGTYFTKQSKCNEFIFNCINHKGIDGNLKKCIKYITDAKNFPGDLKKEVNNVQPKRALSFLRALGYRIKTIGYVDKVQNWNEWMTEVVEQSGLPANDIKAIVENDNLKRLLTYFVEYINANPAILNKNYDSTKQKVKSQDVCPYPWITKLGVPAISRNMKYVKNISDSTNSLYQLLFNSITKPKMVTKQSLFGNNSFGLFNSLSSFAPLLLMGSTLMGGSQKMTFPYFNKDVIRQMNGGNNFLSNILPINVIQHDDHNNINLFYKHIDSIVQHHRNKNMNIFSDAEVNEVKNLVKDLDNLIQKIQKKMGKLELVNQLINSGFPGIEKLIPLNDKLMDKIVVYINTVYNGEYNVKSLLNSIVTAMIEEEFGSINLNNKPITSI